MNHEHSWAKREDWTVCTVCGAIRNHDRPDSQCRGAVKVALRELDTVSAEALRDRLSTIVDEAFGPQEVLDTDALLSRLEHLLTEMVRQHEEVRRERDEARANYQFMVERAADQRLDGYRELGARAAAAENERDEAKAEIAKLRSELELEEKKRAADWCLIGDGHDRLDRVEKSRDLIVRQRDLIERDRDEALARCRTAAQILIAEIGASGPESVEETARRAVAVLQSERGQKKSDLLQDLAAARVALRDLIDACENTRPSHIPIPVVAAIEAARAVLGGRS